jgi:hypothetical protein
VLAALAVGALAASSASALAGPAIKVCKPVVAGGLYPTAAGSTVGHCLESENTVSGSWAWAWPENGGKNTIYCVLKAGSFTEGLCETGPSGKFSELLREEPFPKLDGPLLLSVLTSSAAGLELKIHCLSGNFAAQPATTTLLTKTLLTYKECEVQKVPNCTVSGGTGGAGTIITEPLDSVLLSLTAIDFKPETGTAFVVLAFGGSSCALKSVKPEITGEQQCGFGAGVSEPALLHLVECKTTGSKLKLGLEPATYEGVAHVLVEGSLWWKIR